MTRALTLFAPLLVLAQAMLTQPTLAQEKEKIRLGLDWNYLPYHSPLVIGQDKGFFAEEGIDLVIEQGRGSATAAVMLGEGDYDIGHFNTSNAAVAIAKGAPIKVIAIYQPKTPVSFIGLAGKVKLNGIDSLKQYRIGSTPGGSDQVALKIFRAANNVSEFDLNVVSMEGNSKQTALLSGQIDVVSGDSYTYVTALRSAGQEPVILSMADNGLPLTGVGYSVNNDFAAAHPELVKRFLRAMQKSWQAAAADVPASCARAREVFQMSYSQDDCVGYFNDFLSVSQKGNEADWGHQSDEMWQKMLSSLSEVGEIPTGYDIKQYYTDEFLPE